jgi:hypothetical protein
LISANSRMRDVSSCWSCPSRERISPFSSCLTVFFLCSAVSSWSRCRQAPMQVSRSAVWVHEHVQTRQIRSEPSAWSARNRRIFLLTGSAAMGDGFMSVPPASGHSRKLTPVERVNQPLSTREFPYITESKSSRLVSLFQSRTPQFRYQQAGRILAWYGSALGEELQLRTACSGSTVSSVPTSRSAAAYRA